MQATVIRVSLLAATVATVTLAGAQSGVPGGPNKVAYPADWNKGVMYATVDRPDTKQFREFWGPAAAVQAAREGKPIPYGTVLTLAAYKAQVDAAGNPVRDANGRFVKGELAAVNVMRKERGYGDEIPAALRNGDWMYQSFLPDGKVNDKANLTACYECHKPFAGDDYLTNLAKLANRFPSGAQAAARSGPADVTIANFAFGPGTIKVAAGQAVTWTNGDDTPHQISIAGKSQRSDVMLKGQAATLKFDEAGMFDYVCGLHPTMKGKVEVAAK